MSSGDQENSPAFAVVIPLFNRGSLALRALVSVLEQTRPAAEIIVVDDGSTDGGVDEIRGAFPSVNLITQENRGVGAARNVGIEAASTEWVASLDADDVWAPDQLDELTRMARAFPDAALLSTAHRQWAHEGPLPNLRKKTSRRRVDYFFEAARDIAVVCSSTAAVRRRVALELGGFGPWPRGEDLEFWARLALRYPVAVSATETAWYVRGVEGSMEGFSRCADIRSLPTPRALEEISPSCATVAAHLASRNEGAVEDVSASSLAKYVDSRVLLGISAALVSGDSIRARALPPLLNQPLRVKALSYRVLAYLPFSVLQGTLALRRRMYRRPGVPGPKQ